MSPLLTCLIGLLLVATTLSGKELPVRALVNGYFRGSCPKELSELNRTERSLIALVNVFSKISLLAQGGAYASNGNCYAVINKVSEIVQSLPQLPSIADMAFIRSRNESGKVPREFMYSPWKVKRALEWLKVNNPLYANKVADNEEEFWSSTEHRHIPFIDDAPASLEECCRNASSEETNEVEIPIVDDPVVPIASSSSSSSSSSSYYCSCEESKMEQACESEDDIEEQEGDTLEEEEEGDITQGRSTNAGEPGAGRDILLSDGDGIVPDIAEQVRRVLDDKDEPEVTSIRDVNGRFVSDYKTKNFLAMAFPWLYPYGRGCAGFGTHIKVDKFYFRHVLKYGGDRAFQKCSNFIFYSYSWIMKSAVGVISSVVAKRQEESIMEELTKKHSSKNNNNSSSSSSSSSGSSSLAPGGSRGNKERAVSRGLSKDQLIQLKTFLNNKATDDDVISTEEIKMLLQRLIPFAKEVKGSDMYFKR